MASVNLTMLKEWCDNLDPGRWSMLTMENKIIEDALIQGIFKYVIALSFLMVHNSQ